MLCVVKVFGFVSWRQTLNGTRYSSGRFCKANYTIMFNLGCQRSRALAVEEIGLSSCDQLFRS
ncbi:hypothetical protein M758_7G052900 [Ceratodon purpureus]|nr:hypothetical protein M758_7G052900 [Ceratodon purpureus]